MNLTNAARLAAATGTTVKAVKLIAKVAGVRAATGAGFELTIRPAFDAAKNAVLDQLNIAHDPVQPPTIGSLIASAAMAIITAHDDPRLRGYSPQKITSIITRAKIRSDAGIPLGTEDGPAVAAVFKQHGINVDPNDPTTRALSGNEQEIYDALTKRAQQSRQGQNEANDSAAGRNQTPTSGASQPTRPTADHPEHPTKSQSSDPARIREANSPVPSTSVAVQDSPTTGAGSNPGPGADSPESQALSRSTSDLNKGNETGSPVDGPPTDDINARQNQSSESDSDVLARFDPDKTANETSTNQEELHSSGAARGPNSARPADSPHYSVLTESKLEHEDYLKSDDRHNQEANRQLYQRMQADPEFANSLELHYPGITKGVSPGRRGAFSRTAPISSLTWHHETRRPGVLQLMLKAQHQAPGPIQQSLHPGQKGGRENWGGGRWTTPNESLHFMKLAYILEHADTIPWNLALYLPENCEWDLNTEASVLDPNDCADDQEDPPFAMANGLVYALSIQDVQSVVENARQQLSRIHLDDLLRALEYYFHHDAFVRFDHWRIRQRRQLRFD
jgi:hypothetical protein